MLNFSMKPLFAPLTATSLFITVALTGCSTCEKDDDQTTISRDKRKKRPSEFENIMNRYEKDQSVWYRNKVDNVMKRRGLERVDPDSHWTKQPDLIYPNEKGRYRVQTRKRRK